MPTKVPHSSIKLVKAGGLRIVAGGRALNKIMPEAANDEEKDQNAQFASLFSDICIAQPEVGEGYATFSVAANSGKQIDYPAGNETVDQSGKIWGYHCAAVVARSRDGKDTITLENYNRKGRCHGTNQGTTAAPGCV